jgi:hypothetical protein
MNGSEILGRLFKMIPGESVVSEKFVFSDAKGHIFAKKYYSTSEISKITEIVIEHRTFKKEITKMLVIRTVSDKSGALNNIKIELCLVANNTGQFKTMNFLLDICNSVVNLLTEVEEVGKDLKQYAKATLGYTEMDVECVKTYVKNSIIKEESKK